MKKKNVLGILLLVAFIWSPLEIASSEESEEVVDEVFLLVFSYGKVVSIRSSTCGSPSS